MSAHPQEFRERIERKLVVINRENTADTHETVHTNGRTRQAHLCTVKFRTQGSHTFPRPDYPRSSASFQHQYLVGEGEDPPQALLLVRSTRTPRKLPD
jgi:hypothetical protein